MKTEWVVLIITAITDFVINAGTSLGAAMVATGNATMPSNSVLLLCTLGGIVAASRTIQQALKATPETTAALRGEPAPVSVMAVIPPDPKPQPALVIANPTAPAAPVVPVTKGPL